MPGLYEFNRSHSYPIGNIARFDDLMSKSHPVPKITSSTAGSACDVLDIPITDLGEIARYMENIQQ